MDASGNFYGMTIGGGVHGEGTVYKLAFTGGKWKQTTVYNFPSSCADGCGPGGTPVFDKAGNLYGTDAGGLQNCGGYTCGEVFKLAPRKNGTWKYTALYKFTGGSDGAGPNDVIVDDKGNIFGTTFSGGTYQAGVAFEKSHLSLRGGQSYLSRFTVEPGRWRMRAQAVAKTDTARVQAIFEAAFRQYGLPQAIRTDNGAPFASTAIAGLSRLAVWWIKLGIVAERIEAGHPEQNGRHERMHRTLKQEVAMPPAEDRRAQQRALESFRQEYNEVRPHEALGMQTPASVYEPSERAYPAKVPEPEYPSTMLVCSIHSHGHFRWKKRHDIFLSEVLWGERVGLLPIDERWYTVYFAEVPLARFDSWQRRVVPLPAKKNREGESAAEASSFYVAGAREGEVSPSPAPHPLTGMQSKEKVSGMCPV